VRYFLYKWSDEEPDSKGISIIAELYRSKVMHLIKFAAESFGPYTASKSLPYTTCATLCNVDQGICQADDYSLEERQ
jgi:hypothetical protein